MDIQDTKLELIRLIITIENKSILSKLLSVLRSENDFWLELSESEKQEIQLGISQLDNGQRVSLDDFLKKVS
tara:strand:- start:1661 stop:1876 length:216 start_codon:yes stop_codon:yes gene_type:complete